MIVSVEEAIKEFKAGKMLIMVDDENRENEGDLVIAASFADARAINFMVTHGRGLVCLPSTPQRLRELELAPMVQYNTSKLSTNFATSIDARHNTATGISAADRAETIRVFIDPATRPSDLARPGHVFPLEAREGGVLQRAGHTEGVVDLARLAGLYPAGVLCEILKDDGTMARLPDLREMATKFGLKIVTIKDLIAYRMRKEKLVRRVASTKLPNKHGLWDLHLYENVINGENHVVLVMGNVAERESVLVRVHSQCFTGDTLGSFRCDCGPQLDTAMQKIAAEGCGVIVYLHQEGRGIGLKNKLIAYELQDQGKDTVEANEALGFQPDLREYGIGAQILAALGLHRIRLMTNNPKKLIGLAGYDLQVVGRVPLVVPEQQYNKEYLRIKAEKLGHIFKDDLKEETNGKED
jgi:3,4-dihydroxy 2-butanone 4-phosphate synthase/GTP cyclohydrolase II